MTTWSPTPDNQPLPKVNINPYFSLREKLWLREGVGGQLTRNLKWSVVPVSPKEKIPKDTK